ncbi:CLUMA_CG002876, isoform A [Clunio marinus]|uniref:CLUMA_CG002876, isoform A n=1 Tax=Clunio marinus TaxID=568069 RepID=A0A1J1HN36_9DIPT|nr:CLUMA_CG002876, isoform A [Clunio marinus]
MHRHKYFVLSNEQSPQLSTLKICKNLEQFMFEIKSPNNNLDIVPSAPVKFAISEMYAQCI